LWSNQDVKKNIEEKSEGVKEDLMTEIKKVQEIKKLNAKVEAVHTNTFV
jgi:hypothetical protein